MKEIKFNIPYCRDSHLDSFKKVIKNKKFAGNLIFSKKCQTFLKKKFNFKNILLTDSCSSSFEIIAETLKKFNTYDVLMSSYNYPTVASAFIKRGFNIKFIDTNKDDPRINKEDFLKKLNNNSKIIIITHHAGQAEDIDFFLSLKKEKNFILIEDAAQVINLKFKGKYLGNFGDFSTLSFHETKNVHCGLGGALVFKYPKYKKKIIQIWERGTNRSLKTNQINVKKYEWTELGSNYYPSEFQSCFLYDQLKDINLIKKKRKILFNYYIEKFSRFKLDGDNNLTLMQYSLPSNYHMFYILVKNGRIRSKLINFLNKRNIQCVVHYQPLHNSIYSRKKKLKIDHCKNTVQFANRILRLPMHTYLEKRDLSKIVTIIDQFFKKSV